MTFTDQESRQFILLRKQAQDSATAHARKFITDTATAIIALAWSYRWQTKKFRFSRNEKLNKQADSELSSMKRKIRQTVITLSEYVNDKYSQEKNLEADKKETDEFIDTPIGNTTYNQRADRYSRRFKHELEAILAAAFFFNVSRQQLITLVTTFIGSLYNTDLYKRALKTGGFCAARLEDEPDYGNGQYKHSFNSFIRLVDNTIGMAWMYFLGNEAERSGKRFFYSLRGSTYPCSLCDSEQAKGIRPIEEYTGLYHARCKCRFIFLDGFPLS